MTVHNLQIPENGELYCSSQQSKNTKKQNNLVLGPSSAGTKNTQLRPKSSLTFSKLSHVAMSLYSIMTLWFNDGQLTITPEDQT